MLGGKLDRTPSDQFIAVLKSDCRNYCLNRHASSPPMS
jgi:hypothetical protein